MQIQRSPSVLLESSVSVYRLLVRLYPPEFRAEYGSLMVQAFRDTCLRSGPGGIPGVWGHTLADTFLSIIEQYSNRGAVMTKTRWI